MKSGMMFLALLGFLAGCDTDCENFDRMDGTYAVWQTANNSPASGAEGAFTISEGYATQELFINGWTRWKISYQASNEGMNIVMTDVLEATDLPGEDKVFIAVPLSGSLATDEGNCNVVDLTIKDTYDATVTGEDGIMQTKNTHDFSYTARLVYYGDHLSGTYTYSDTYSGIDREGNPLSGQIDGVTGSFSGTLKAEDDFDTGF